MKKLEIEIPEKLFGLLKDYCYEMETNLNVFCLDALIEKFNNENEVLDCDLDEKGNII